MVKKNFFGKIRKIIDPYQGIHYTLYSPKKLILFHRYECQTARVATDLNYDDE